MIDAGKTMALALLSICVNIVLMAVKIAAGIAGNSYALVADGIESAGDIFTSLVTWVGFRMSLRPPDENHPFGHGKIESLAGLFAGLSILGAAGFIAWNEFLEIRSPQHGPEWFTLPVLLAVVAVKWAVAVVIRRLGQEIDSRAIEGDAWHHLSDALTSGAAAIGIAIALIGGRGWESADDYAAIAACAIIIVNGSRIATRALHDMLDGNVPEDLVSTIRDSAGEVGGVLEIEKCRVRKSGIGLFIELHVCVSGDTTVREGHRIGHEVKDHMLASNARIQDVVVHLEPLEDG